MAKVVITFEPLKINQSYIPHLKELVCGINTFSSQWCGWIFIVCYTHLKLALLLHKTVLVNFPIATTVSKSAAQMVCRVQLALELKVDSNV